MKKILITGALGHIGSKLIHSIKEGEFDCVYLLDNLLTQRYSSLFNLPQGVNFNFFEKDIVSTELDQYFTGIDVVIHLAAITDATNSHINKKEIEKINYIGTKKVAEACVRNGCKLIFPSTTSIYYPEKIQNGEVLSSEVTKTLNPYAESKLKAEHLLQLLGDRNKLNYVIFRFGTIFGPSIGMRFHTAVNKFCWQAVMNQPITVWKTALYQKRPYLGVGDAIRAFRFAIVNDLFDKTVYDVVTLNTTVNEIINSIRKNDLITNLEFIDAKIMNQLSYNISNEKFEKMGFDFQDDLENGISDTITLLRNAHYQLI